MRVFFMYEDIRCRDHEWVAGYKFVKWGIGFFLFGLLMGFGVLIHYLIGARYTTGNDFLARMTLWFGSPLSLSATYLQVGGLAMAVIGLAKKVLAKCSIPGHNDCCDSTTS